MKKSAFSLLAVVLAAGLADRGAALAVDLPPAGPVAAASAQAPAVPTVSPLDSAAAGPTENVFITPGASSGRINDAAFGAAAQVGPGRLPPDAPQIYGPGAAAADVYGRGNEIPTSRMMGPVNRPVPHDPETAGRIINNSYDGDWFDYCGPKGGTCCDQIYFAAEAILLDRRDATRKGISLNPANFTYGLQTTDPNFRWDEVAPRLTIGRLFCDWAVEGTMIYTDDISAHANGSAGGTVNDAIFFGVQPVGSNYTNATAMRLDIYDGFHSYELNAVDTRSFFQMIYGVRYIEFREQLSVSSTSATGTSGAHIGTYNRMIGGQIGVRMEYVNDFANLEFNLKGGMYQNEANIGTNIRDFNNTTVLRNTHFDGQNEAYLAEMNLLLTYRVSNSIKAKFGYQMIYIGEIALAPDQIDENRTAANATGFLPSAHGDMLMRGFTAGLEYRW